MVSSHLMSYPTALDRSEIQDFFHSMGISLSRHTLDDIMQRFDSDSDGSISLEEFKAMMEELQGSKKDGNNFWKGLGNKLKSVVSNKGVTRKLEVAFGMQQVINAEKLADNTNYQSSKFVDKDLAPLSLVINLHGMKDPMVVICSKPGQVEAWVDAFRICTAWALENVDWGVDELTKNEDTKLPLAYQDDWRTSTIDWGMDDEEEDDLAFSKDDYKSYKCT